MILKSTSVNEKDYEEDQNWAMVFWFPVYLWRKTQTCTISSISSVNIVDIQRILIGQPYTFTRQHFRFNQYDLVNDQFDKSHMHCCGETFDYIIHIKKDSALRMVMLLMLEFRRLILGEIKIVLYM